MYIIFIIIIIIIVKVRIYEGWQGGGSQLQ